MAEEKLDEDLDLGIEKEGGSKKKLIIIIAAAVLVLLLGGGAAWFFLSGDESDVDGAEAQQEQAQEEEQAEEEKLPPLYHTLQPVFVVNLPPGGDAKMLQVGVNIMVRQPELLEFLKLNDPMIRHQLLNIFSVQDSATLRDRAGKEKLQTEVLAELQRIVNDNGGPGKVEGVFFSSFVMQ
jgi:flagellar FliL protein